MNVLDNQHDAFDLGTFWRRKWTLFSATTLSVVVGVVYAFIAPSVFDADARLVVNQTGFAFQDRRIEDREFLATQAEVVRSPITVGQALKVAPLSGLGPDDDPIKLALEALQVTPVLNTDVMRISFRGNSAEETVQFVDAVIKAYRQQLKTNEHDENTQTLELLAQREAKLRSELEELQRQHLAHRSLVPLVGQGREAIHVGGEMLRQLSAQVAEARRRRMAVQNASQALASYGENIARRRREARLRLASLTAGAGILAALAPAPEREPTKNAAHVLAGEFLAGDDDILPSVPAMAAHLLQSVAAPSVHELTALYAEQRQALLKEKELAQTFGERHPSRAGLTEQLAELKTMITRWEIRAASVLQKELELARRTEQNLVTLYEQERQEQKDADKFLVQDQHLTDNLQRLGAAHDVTLQKLNDWKLAAESIDTGRPSVTVRMLQGPQSTLRKVWPKKGPIVLVCGVLGLVAAAAWVFFTERRGSDGHD